MLADRLAIAPEVARALADGRPVVALESTLISHGLPYPANLEVARASETAVREAGAIPATVAIHDRRLLVGLDEPALEALATAPEGSVRKAARPSLAASLAAGGWAATTVSATMIAAHAAGISVFATGGIGGVHRVAPDEAGDVSADLAELARSAVCVVCAGPKAILDLPATAEALESLGVLSLGFGTSELPAFYSDGSGVALEHRVETAAEAATVLRVHWEDLGRREGVLLLVPPPSPVAREDVEAAIAGGLAEARQRGVRGKAVTPFLLDAVSRATGGRTRDANLALLERNAAVGGAVAAALADRR
jgi:pseudouridine-5'-phosphate glycosidase